ncbi:DUF6392 family protein [Serratia proteamaculans]|uniref:DUF6392 family protein n=1 Tax=Serratia proteamaculans TaxID=28151 RepID=UPI003D02C906
MNSENMERLIKNLGCSYDALIASKVIDNLPLQSLYEDGESLEIEPASGIELVFWPETFSFEVIHITLKDDQYPDAPIYSGELPEPYASIKNQEQARKILGDPIFTKSPMALQGTGLSGWDTYQLDSKLHPAALLEFQYINHLLVGRIIFSLIDKNV